jgi:hypothetical protein
VVGEVRREVIMVDVEGIEGGGDEVVGEGGVEVGDRESCRRDTRSLEQALLLREVL